MKIALVAKKGGVGKSTLCLLLHEAFVQIGSNVAIRDYDPQGTITKSLEFFGGTKAVPGDEYDTLLIDTPPSLNMPATISAVQEASVILIPTGASPADVWEAEEAVMFAKEKNPEALIYVVINKLRQGTILTKNVQESLKPIKQHILKTYLSDRQCYMHALVSGYGALDSKARHELTMFALNVSSLSNHKRDPKKTSRKQK